MYEADFKALDDELVDLDRSLIEQSDTVKFAFRDVLGDLGKEILPRVDSIGGLRVTGGSSIQRSGDGQLWLAPPGSVKMGDSVWYRLTESDALNLVGANGSARRAYILLSKKLGGDEAASKFLNSKGVKGLKYLDQGSRGLKGGKILDISRGADGKYRSKVQSAGKLDDGAPESITTSMPFDTETEAIRWARDKTAVGTNNYVVFNDKDLEILKVLGITGMVGTGAAVAAGANGQLPTH
jgi:hypothetical protein